MSNALPRTITVHDCQDCPWTRYERYGEKLSAVCNHPDILFARGRGTAGKAEQGGRAGQDAGGI